MRAFIPSLMLVLSVPAIAANMPDANYDDFTPVMRPGSPGGVYAQKTSLDGACVLTMSYLRGGNPAEGSLTIDFGNGFISHIMYEAESRCETNTIALRGGGSAIRFNCANRHYRWDRSERGTLTLNRDGHITALVINAQDWSSGERGPRIRTTGHLDCRF